MSARHRIAVTWLLSSATALADPPPHGRPPLDADQTRALYGLRSELSRVKTDAEMAEKFDHFRPLCDKDGYPLVGNVITKGEGPKFGPGGYCAAVRAKTPKKST